MLQEMNTILLSPLAILILLVFCFALICITINLSIKLTQYKTDFEVLYDKMFDSFYDTKKTQGKIINNLQEVITRLQEVTNHLQEVLQNNKDVVELNNEIIHHIFGPIVPTKDENTNETENND